MFKANDPFSFTKSCCLYVGGQTAAIGRLYFEYRVTAYDRVQVSDAASVNKPKQRSFLLHCSQRINIFNAKNKTLTPQNSLASYENYPVLINASMLVHSSSGLTCELRDFSPKTVNTKIQMSGVAGQSDGKTASFTSSNTVGSSTSQTNSYGATVSTESASVNYEHSTTQTEDQSHTVGTEAGSSISQDSSSSADMSIKDWGAYAQINPSLNSAAWIFGQEYPWDIIQCRKTTGRQNPSNGDQTEIVIPSSSSVRLYDGVSLYPPSQLSMFGFNFIMKAFWLITIDNDQADEITIEHVVNYFSGSHGVDLSDPTSPPVISAYADTQPATLSVEGADSLATILDLPLMGLDVIGKRGNSAIVGFIPNKFTVLPMPLTETVAATPFKIISTDNNLLIKDTTAYPNPTSAGAGVGFSSSETAISATFSSSCPSLEVTLFFKVTDTIHDYTLYLKHWKTGAVGIVLTFIFNGESTNPITRYVDSTEAEGGDNNLSAIVLRNQDYSSVDYHDYLQLGLNSITVSVSPIGGSGNVSNCGYQIRAISIEKS